MDPKSSGGTVAQGGFEIRETVVHPRHGIAVIEGRYIRKLEGQEREYLRIRVPETGLVLNVPVERAAEVGLRPVMSSKQANKILKILGESESESEGNWVRRQKANDA